MALLDRDAEIGTYRDTEEVLPWSDVRAVHAEWPQDELSPPEDLLSWHEGLTLYQREDYPSMIEAAELMSPALAHHLYGPGVLTGATFPTTVHHVLFAATSTPPDGRTFVDSARRNVRLALTVARGHGWQPRHLGGDDMLGDLFDDRATFGRLGAAIAPPGHYAGDLRDFFLTPAPVTLPESS